jgi:UDP-glucuronate 4-epimerase
MSGAIVTGAAGFIGSQLAESLVASGQPVLGIDSLTDYYDISIKSANLRQLQKSPNFRFAEVDLISADLEGLIEGADVIFHLAGQPGVRGSFAEGFSVYADNNILATQRLLEATKAVRTPRFVFASSSSVYGNAPRYPTVEDDLPRPFSPYGVTKLAAEHLCSLYAANWGLSTVSLRYFSVFGPRQRPDMAMHRLIRSALHRTNFELFGGGAQVRDFTYVGDVVAANLAAAAADVEPGTVLNVAGGSSASMLEVIDMIGEIVGEKPIVRSSHDEAGDVAQTGGSFERAHRLIGWEPRVALHEGLAAQVQWAREEMSAQSDQLDTAPR